MCLCTHTNIPQHLMWQSKDSCRSQFSPPMWVVPGMEFLQFVTLGHPLSHLKSAFFPFIFETRSYVFQTNPKLSM